MLGEAQKEAENFAPGDPRRSTTSKELADISYMQGNYTEAEPLYWTILPDLEHNAGSEAPKFAFVLTNLAHILLAKGKYADAEKLAKQALSLEEKSDKVGSMPTASTRHG